jgi:hypothetical protein
MMATFQTGDGDWTRYRELGDVLEVDFHYSQDGPRMVRYHEAMGDVYDAALEALRTAYASGKQYVLFTHGSSTARPGHTTARSQIRRLLRSKEATPFVHKSRSIQHHSVFVAAIRDNPAGRESHAKEIDSQIQRILPQLYSLIDRSANETFKRATKRSLDNLKALPNREYVLTKLSIRLANYQQHYEGRCAGWEEVLF